MHFNVAHLYRSLDAIKVLFTTLNATWRGLALIEPNLPPDTVSCRQLRVWCDPLSSTLTFTAAQPAGLLLNVDWLAALRRLPEWSTGGVYGENHSLFYSLPLQLHRSICHTNTHTATLIIQKLNQRKEILLQNVLQFDQAPSANSD